MPQALPPMADDAAAHAAICKEQAARDKTLKMLRTAMRDFIEYFDDPLVAEIMLNEDKSLWAERFISIVSTVTQDKINKQKPFLSGELPIWGSRIQAVIPPGSTNPIWIPRPRTSSSSRSHG